MKIYTERRGNLRNNWRVFMRLCRPSSQPSTLFFQLAPPLEFSLFVSGLCLGSRGFWGLSSCSRSYRSRCSPGSSSSSQQQPQLVWKLRPEAAANEPWAFFFLDKVQWRPPITNQRSPLPNLLNTLRPLFGKYFNTLFLHGPKRFRGSLCWETVVVTLHVS